MMTTDQLAMARHALGLPNDSNQSYRNRYVAGTGTTHETEWNELVAQGLAERGSPGIAVVGFCLTESGARAALAFGEKLDPEDFPPST